MSESSRWYRQPVAWLFFILLAVTVLACVFLMYVAVRSDDGLVSDDYYKRGNEIGMEMGRDRQASALGLSAQLMVADDGRSLRVLLLPLPAQGKELTLRLSHPTRAGLDRVIRLRPDAGGMLLAELPDVLPTQRWLVQLEEGTPAKEATGWRLRAEARLAPGAVLQLRPQAQ